MEILRSRVLGAGAEELDAAAEATCWWACVTFDAEKPERERSANEGRFEQGRRS
jgi:hypothetical protein